ncbi:CPBP family intramembrane metalloprotease domain-containing protein, partial [Halorubrum ezzemoulense]
MTEADTDTNFERTASRSTDDDRRTNYGGITGRVVSVLWNRTENRPRVLWRILGVEVAALLGIFVLPGLALAGTELPP